MNSVADTATSRPHHNDRWPLGWQLKCYRLAMDPVTFVLATFLAAAAADRSRSQDGEMKKSGSHPPQIRNGSSAGAR